MDRLETKPQTSAKTQRIRLPLVANGALSKKASATVHFNAVSQDTCKLALYLSALHRAVQFATLTWYRAQRSGAFFCVFIPQQDYATIRPWRSSVDKSKYPKYTAHTTLRHPNDCSTTESASALVVVAELSGLCKGLLVGGG